MDYIQTGIAKNLIQFNDDHTRINYVIQQKSDNFKDPEEKVRAQAYIQLVVDYGYPPNRISIENKVQMGVAVKSADIIVFDDDAKKQPYIIVECKREEATNAEFKLGIDEGFSYAVSVNAKYLWVTSKLLDNYYDVASFPALQRTLNQIADIPHYGKKEISKARYYKGAKDEDGNKAFDIEIVPQSELTRRFRQAHDAFWAGGKRDASEAFDELNKLIFCKIWDEKKKRRIGTPYDFQVFSNEVDGTETLERLERIEAIYAEAKKLKKKPKKL